MSALSLALTTWLVMWGVFFQSVDDLIPGYWEQTPLPQTGQATYYAPGLMEYVEGVRRERGQLPECPECVGAVALLRAGDIGRKVWLQPPGSEGVGPFLVIDCAHREDVVPLLDRNWVVDVSYEVGQFWGMDRPLDGVTVYADPADAGAVSLLAAPTPFVVDPGAVVISRPTPTSAVTASPPVTSAPPTPWPTRLPQPLVPQVQAPAETSESTPSGPPPPTPLTPVVTTPTPRAQPTRPPPGQASATPQPSPAGPTEVALGRPGHDLLLATPSRVEAPAPATPTAKIRPTVTQSSAPAEAATPTPILRDVRPSTPAPPVQRSLPLIIRLWRVLLSLWNTLSVGGSG